MLDDYGRHRQFFRNVSGNYRVLAADTGVIALVAPIPRHTIFIQKIHIEVTTLAASETWTFQDSAGTPIPLHSTVSAAALGHFDVDFGPDGIPCTEAKGFDLNVAGATGAIGFVAWEAYAKLTLATP